MARLKSQCRSTINALSKISETSREHDGIELRLIHPTSSRLLKVLSQDEMSKKLALAARLLPILPEGFELPLSPRAARRAAAAQPKEAGLPFFRDPSHTLPTRRLYRHLLRLTGGSSSSEGSGDDAGRARNWQEVRWGLKRDWKAHQHLTSIPQARNFLASQLELRSRLHSSSGDLRRRAVGELLAIANRHHRLDARQAKKSIKKPPPKPHLTGGFLRPSIFNPPLPRLFPQPESISMMIHHRLRARENRQAKVRIMQDWGRDMKAEMAFYRDVYSESSDDGKRKAREIRKVNVPGTDAKFMGGWDTEFTRSWEIFQEQFGREIERSASKYSPELVERVHAAKRTRDASKRDRAERRKAREEAVRSSSAGENEPLAKPPY